MDNAIVWDSTATYDLALSHQVGKPWFGNAEIVAGINSLPLAVVNSPKRKIAFVYYFFGKGLDIDLSWADLVVCLNWEVINDEFEQHYDIARKHFNNNNIIFIIGGAPHLQQTQEHKRFLCPYLSFLNKVVFTNESTDYDYLSPRPYVFDALLGGIKFHRKIIFDKLYTSGLLAKSLVSMTPAPGDYYFNGTGYEFTVTDFQEYASPELDKFENPVILEFKKAAVTIEQKHSVNSIPNVYYKGTNCYRPSMSFIVPDRIYQNCWYSIVAETNYKSHNFLTEKTAKPLFAKRIFVCFGSQGHLKFLQAQGFKTFHDIIDESYDNEPDHVRRYEMAWQQIITLAESDPVKIYQQAIPILDYNFNQLNRVADRMQQVQEFIQSFWKQI